jgi:hypothetical protein
MRPLPLLALALVGGCDFLGPKDTDFRQRALDETVRREALWKQEAIHNYDFHFERDCACALVAIQPVEIHVRNDVVARVVDAQGADVEPQTGIPWPTVDSLFIWSRQLINNKAFAVEIGFDSTLSFPNHILAENPSSGVSIAHNSRDLTAQTATAPIRADYRIAVPDSKSKSVTWRNR